MAAWWDEEGACGALGIPTHFRLDVSGGLYPYDHEYMVRLVSLDLSRAEWNEACR